MHKFSYRAARALSIAYIIMNMALSIQIVFRADDVKILCFMIMTVMQACVCMGFAIIFFPGRWINHRRGNLQKVTEKYGVSEKMDEEFIPQVESVTSSSIL